MDDLSQDVKKRLGIECLNAMQEAVLAQSDAANMMVLSPTGSGKTLAFALATISHLRQDINKTQAVVITPTRELATQTANTMRIVAQGFKVGCVYGGRSVKEEVPSLTPPPQILIATPGRLLDHSRQGIISINDVRILVIDEFDKTLELGFEQDMRQAFRLMNKLTHKILTSATRLNTLPPFLDMSNCAVVDFLEQNRVEERLETTLVNCADNDKFVTICKLLHHVSGQKTIVFVNTRENAESLYHRLKKHNIDCGVYHGLLEQTDRQKAIAMFNNGTHPTLVATDLGSRGLDIDNVQNIVHYELPLTQQIYLHRNGRTARVNASGNIFVIVENRQNLPEFISFDRELSLDSTTDYDSGTPSPMATLYFKAGRKEKLSKADILGFITHNATFLQAAQIGKIDVMEHYSLAAIPRELAQQTLDAIGNKKIKGKRIIISLAKG
ncbi:MAG: DEAD/DEAH box helicase [Muribaculaceae bacterium]|nr:DEAD/DEAH box helicase [Muribaculaceae bacterium]